MHIDVLTLFPDMCTGAFTTSILGKAQQKACVTINTVNFRDYATDKHQVVDDYPYGGGCGMVLKPQPIFAAVEDMIVRRQAERGLLQEEDILSQPRIVLTCPQGERFTQRKAEELAQQSHLIIICGHYEGYDERIREHLVTDELSVGDYVLTGGELPALIIVDSVVRLLSGVLGNELSALTDSFTTGLLEHPHYTRPAQFRGWKVPDILLSGHHANIEKWRRKQALKRTLERRSDLLQHMELTSEDMYMLEQLIRDIKVKNNDG